MQIITETTDAPDAYFSPYIMNVEDVFRGTLVDRFDRDGIGINMVAGTSYNFVLRWSPFDDSADSDEFDTPYIYTPDNYRFVTDFYNIGNEGLGSGPIDFRMTA